MIPDLDERLKRIIAGYSGDQHGNANPEEGLDLEGIRALGETMTPSGGEDLPRGTKVNFAEPEPDAAVPAPPRVPLQTPKVVQVPTSAQPSQESLQAAYARAEDERAQKAMAMERGGRDLVAGITRTAPQPVINRPTDAFAQQQAASRAKKNDELRATEAANNAARTKAYLENGAATTDQAGKRLGLAEKEAAARDERFKTDQSFKQTELDRKKAEDAWKHAHPKSSGKAPPARDASGALVPTSYRDQLRANGVALRPDEELIDPKGIGYRDAAQAKRADDLRGNLAKLEEHRAQANEAIAEYHAAKTVAEKDNALVKLNVAMSNAASMTRQAENMGQSIDAQHNIDKMMSTVGGDVRNWQNLLNEGRIDTALGAAVTSAAANVDGQLAHNNVRIKKGGQAGPAAATGAPPGKIHVTNGKETMEIDEGDEQAAAADGFKRVGK